MSEIRDKNGRFIPGYEVPPDLVQRVNESERPRRTDLPSDYPELKRCNKCNEWKESRFDFYIRKETLKSGEVVLRPDGRCRDCKKEEFAERRAERKRLGLTTEDHRRWHANEDKEKRRARNREYAAVYRRKKGQKVVGPWLKYRETPRSDSIDMRPLAAYVKSEKERMGLTVAEICRRAEIDDRRWRNLMNPTDQSRVTTDFAERILKALDPDIHLSEVYPELYE